MQIEIVWLCPNEAGQSVVANEAANLMYYDVASAGNHDTVDRRNLFPEEPFSRIYSRCINLPWRFTNDKPWR